MSKKLLIADDSVTIQRVIELTFADEDIRVVAVGDGQQAIDRIDADPPDIILADVDMPKRNGYEVASYVKGKPGLAHIPVVLLTGAFEPVDRARAAAVRSDDVLAKPFEPQMVINRVKQLLSGAGKAGSPQLAAGSAAAGPIGQEAGGHARPAPGSAALAGSALPSPAASPQPGGDMRGDSGNRADSEKSQVSLDEYFDQLDAAFSHMRPGHPATPGGAASEAPREAEELQWIASETPPAAPRPEEWALPDLKGQTPPDVLGSMTIEHAAAGSAQTRDPVPAITSAEAPGGGGFSAIERPPAEPVVEPRSAGPLPAAAPPLATAPPPIADAFAALLAAEQGEPSPLPAVISSAAPAAAITDAQIDGIVARVIERLSDSGVREQVSDTVSRIAERLVREEIERIKARVT